LAEYNDKTDTRLSGLHEQVKEAELMLEDEVGRLEELMGDRLAASDQKMEDRLAQVSGVPAQGTLLALYADSYAPLCVWETVLG
jgi:hypothetical protein